MTTILALAAMWLAFLVVAFLFEWALAWLDGEAAEDSVIGDEPVHGPHVQGVLIGQFPFDEARDDELLRARVAPAPRARLDACMNGWAGWGGEMTLAGSLMRCGD